MNAINRLIFINTIFSMFCWHIIHLKILISLFENMQQLKTVWNSKTNIAYFLEVLFYKNKLKSLKTLFCLLFLLYSDHGHAFIFIQFQIVVKIYVNLKKNIMFFLFNLVLLSNQGLSTNKNIKKLTSFFSLSVYVNKHQPYILIILVL